jgi:hypothetical protein
MKNEPMPDKKWPDVEIDRITIESYKSVVDLLKEAGYNIIDVFGLLVGHEWPLDIINVLKDGRKEKVENIIKITHDKGIKIIYGLGVYIWGFNNIIKNDPMVRGTNPSAMCGSKLESQKWQEKIIDFISSNFDIDGFHLESSDEGRCKCPQCIKENNVQYYSRLNAQVAKHVREKWPDKILLVDDSCYLSTGDFFTEGDFKYLYEMSKYIDVFIDNGNIGMFVKIKDRKKFISGLNCDFGTGGGFWVYPPQHWDRLRWFLPYVNRAGSYVKLLCEDGGRACRFLMGPTINPSTELNILFGGLLFSNLERDIKDVLEEVIDKLYKPKNDTACNDLVDIFIRAENAYFDNWSLINIPKFQNILLERWEQAVIIQRKYQKESFDKVKILSNRSEDKIEAIIPGELHLEPLSNSDSDNPEVKDSPGSPIYLIDNMNTEGRSNYRRELNCILNDLLKFENEFDDSGRIKRIKVCINNVIKDLDSIGDRK